MMELFYISIGVLTSLPAMIVLSPTIVFITIKICETVINKPHEERMKLRDLYGLYYLCVRWRFPR